MIDVFRQRKLIQGLYRMLSIFVYSPTPLPSFQETYTQRYTRQELQSLGLKMDECYDTPVYCTTTHYPEFSAAVPYEQQPQQQHPHHHPQHHQQAPHHHQSYFPTESAPTPATTVVPSNHRQDPSYGVTVAMPIVYGAPSVIAVATPVVPTDLCPTVVTSVDSSVIGTTRPRRASLPTQRSESAR